MSNSVVHFEVAGPNESTLKDFYQEVLSWTLEPMGPGYTLLRTPPGSPDGAIREAEEPGLSVGVAVLDLDASLRKATGSGGNIVMPATDNGYVRKGQIADPAGNVITLIESAEPTD